MWTVGIETSSREGSVALLHGDELIVERALSQSGRQHARTLIAELQQMLAEAGLAARRCDVLAVSRGPGSFTGLRVGVVCAKTWSFACGCAIVGIETFHAIAERAPADIHEVDVIADAQRAELYVGRYRRQSTGLWQRQGELQIISVEDWLGRLPGDRVVTGPAVEMVRDRISGRACLLPPGLLHPTAAGIARLGRRAAMDGRTGDAWSLEPLYLRRSAAEEKSERGSSP